MRHRSPKGRRSERVASVIRQVVSRELVTRLNDPRLAFVTVTGVDLAADLRFADVRVSILGDAKAQEGCFRAIRHAHGHLQEKVAEALVTKFCPVLRFHRDESVKRSISLSTLIARARAEDEANRADRIRRGVEPPDAVQEFEESPVMLDEDEPGAADEEEDADPDAPDDEDPQDDPDKDEEPAR